MIVAKRCFLLLSLLYIYRAITMSITVLPISSSTYYCSPKKSSSFLEVLQRSFWVFTGMGLSINGQQQYCGDSIFSGHSTILMFAYLVLEECKFFFVFVFQCHSQFLCWLLLSIEIMP